MEGATYPLYNRRFEIVCRIPYVTEALVCYQGKYYMWYGENQIHQNGYNFLPEPGYVEENIFHWHGQVMDLMKDPIE